MGIEGFFRHTQMQFSKDEKLVYDFKYPYNKIMCEHLFLDFNSIIHTTSQSVIERKNRIAKLKLYYKRKKDIEEELDTHLNFFKKESGKTLTPPSPIIVSTIIAAVLLVIDFSKLL